jgi:hypothetical protein
VSEQSSDNIVAENTTFYLQGDEQMSDQQVRISDVFALTEAPEELRSDPEIARKLEIEAILISVRQVLSDNRQIEEINEECFGIILALPIVGGEAVDHLAHAKFVQGQLERRLAFEQQAAAEQIAYLDSLVAIDPEVVERAESFNAFAKLIGSALRDLAAPGNPFADLGA